jgi:3-hydroxymyristoyl/3-hydroxydecanoyl-(acyl carrier protein) dehydratase
MPQCKTVMSLIAKTTGQCLARMGPSAEGEWSAAFVFPLDYPGFSGHFPDGPVLPGVCMVEAVLCVLAAAGLGRARLTRLTSAKWASPVHPEEELLFKVRLSDTCRGAQGVKALVTRAGQKVAELNLAVTFTPNSQGSPP